MEYFEMRRLGRTVISIINKTFPIESKLLGAEIGVYRGDTSAGMLRTFPELKLNMVDPYDMNIQDRYCRPRNQATQDARMEEALTVTEFAADRRKMWRIPSMEALDLFSDGIFDFVFVDANHEYEYVKDDMKWWKKIKPGGLFLGDNYDGWIERVWEGRKWGVKLAVDEFATANDLEVRTHRCEVWSIQK